MNTPRRRTLESEPQVPQAAPQAGFGQQGHDFTLQAIMDLKQSFGELKTTMQGVKESVDSTKGKVDDLVGWKNKIIGGVAVIGVVGAVLGWVVAKASDYVTVRVPVNSPIVLSPAPGPTPAASTPPPSR